MIAIIDYGAGNLFGVANAFKKLNCQIEITRDKDVINSAQKVVLPGVGSFKEAMENLKKSHLINTVYDLVEADKPFLGICVGLQMCFERSEEGNVNGLGIFKGRIKKFPIDICKKVPQMGWNKANIIGNSPVFNNIDDNYFYFVHSYYLEAVDREKVIATTNYGIEFDCAYAYKNTFLTQFHPEKSGKTGLKFLENFVNL